jgi:hypothetical protein
MPMRVQPENSTLLCDQATSYRHTHAILPCKELVSTKKNGRQCPGTLVRITDLSY